MSEYSYTLRDRLGSLIVSPLGESDFSITWSRDTDEGKMGYKKDFGGTITFIGKAYQRLLSLEQTIYRCEFQDITINRACTPSRVWFSGTISLNSGVWDLDGCKVSVKFQSDSTTKCFDDNKSEEVDLFEMVPFRNQVKMFPGDAEIETRNCSRVYGASSGLEYYWCGSGDPFLLGWSVYFHEQKEISGTTEVTTKWARQKTVLPCDQIPSPDWSMITDNCATDNTRTYVRRVNLYDCIYRNNTDIGGSWDFYYLMECSVFGLSEDISFFRNGMRLVTLLEQFVDRFCPDKTFKSDFLTQPINYVTGIKSKTDNLFLFQKSDIKRPESATVATRAPWTFEKIVNMVVNAYNLRWDIIGDEFIIEHVSFFDRDIGLNLTQAKYSKFVKGRKQYSYKEEEMPSLERWDWMESKRGTDFKGVPITYSNGCVTQGSRDIKKEYLMEDVTTDIEFVISNPDPDSSVVEDEGFVLIAAEKENNGDYFIITEAGVLDEPRLNNSLGVSQLLRDYHTYNRPYKEGMMNGAETIFETVKPTKLGATLSIPFCCDDEFDPKEYVRTFFGLGIVDKAIFNFKTSIISLDLLYNAYEGLLENSAPKVFNQVVRIYKNETILIEVTQGWTDTDPNASIASVEIKTFPSHGSAILQGNHMVRYTPAANYVGNDNFTFSIKDNWGEESNTALISIEVREPAQPPVAMDDFYTTKKNTVLYVLPPSVFSNDTPYQGFTLLNYDPTSTHGGTVLLLPEGRLTFTPSNNFIGEDSFTYKIQDEWGRTSTATVFIDVTDPNVPIAVTDNYLTSVNISLQTEMSGPAFGLLHNDYTPSGTIPLNATSGTFTTQAGGIVIISSNGTFLYTPPLDFEGKDSFQYTVNNVHASAIGTAYIDVIGKLYVRLSGSNNRIIPIEENCDGVITRVGTARIKDLTLKFYEDAAGNTPYDITGLNLQIFATFQQRDLPNGPWSNSPITFVATGGTTWLLEEDFQYKYTFDGCDGAAGINKESRITIEDASHYQMI